MGPVEFRGVFNQLLIYLLPNETLNCANDVIGAHQVSWGIFYYRFFFYFFNFFLFISNVPNMQISNMTNVPKYVNLDPFFGLFEIFEIFLLADGDNSK